MFSITVSSQISKLQRKFANLKHFFFNFVNLPKREKVPSMFYLARIYVKKKKFSLLKAL